MGSEGKANSSSGKKRQRRSSLDEEAQKDWAIILVDSPDRTPNDQQALEGAPNEAGATLEEGVPVMGPFVVEEIRDEAPPGVADAPMLPPRFVGARSSRKRPPDRLLLSMYVSPLDRIHPLTGMVAPNPEGVLEIARF